MRKGGSIIIGVIVLALLVGGGYAVFHKSSKNPVSSSSSTSSKSTVPAVNNAVVITKTDSTVGQYLADPSGNTLYTYNADTPGVSNCTGSCLENWPAYVDKGSTTDLPSGIGTITRSDNHQVQYTYNGMPLYYFTSDSKGKVTGNGVENFSVAKPAAATSSQSAPTSSPSTTSSSTNSSSSSGYPY